MTQDDPREREGRTSHDAGAPERAPPAGERGGDALDPYGSTIQQRFAERAHALLRRRGQRLDPETLSLVNNVYLGMLRTERAGNLPEFTDSLELIKYLARAMRNYLVNRAAARRAACRPPEEQRVDWPQSHSFPATNHEPSSVLDVHEALVALAKRDETAALVVELIFFGGCTQAEVAEILGRPERAVRSDWEFARVWLRDRLKSHERRAPDGPGRSS